MLSDETASGQYPVQSVKVMKRIILYTQANSPVKPQFETHEDHRRQAAICDAVIHLADQVEARAIVAETKSGATALQIASRRPSQAVLAVTSSTRVAQQLAIIYGAKTYIRPDDKHAAKKLTDWLQHKRALKKGDIIVTASGQNPGVVGTTDTIKVRVL
jgi:pyruvate kinase